MNYHQAELYHHGILGQKWGVRRYQNSDGTYTAAGKARRNDSYEPGKQKQSKSSSDSNSKNAGRTKKNHLKMDNDELKEAIDRLKMEKEYIQLKKDTRSAGQAFVSDVMTSIGKKTLTQLGVSSVMYSVAKFMDKKDKRRERTAWDNKKAREAKKEKGEDGKDDWVDENPFKGLKYWSDAKNQW